MGYVLELLSKEFITDNGGFLNAANQIVGGNATSSIPVQQSNISNIPSDVPSSYIASLNKANEKKSQASQRLNKLLSDLAYKTRLLAFIKEKMQSDNTAAISEAIVMSGRCGRQTFDSNNLVVSLDDGVFAKGCSDPVWNPIGRGRERDYANNYWKKVLPSEISTINANIITEKDNIKLADEEIEGIQNDINKHLQTKAQYDLKQAEAKNYPEAQRIKAEKEQALRALEIEAAERSQRASLRSKNIRIGLFIVGGAALLVGGVFLMSKKK